MLWTTLLSAAPLRFIFLIFTPPTPPGSVNSPFSLSFQLGISSNTLTCFCCSGFSIFFRSVSLSIRSCIVTQNDAIEGQSLNYSVTTRLGQLTPILKDCSIRIPSGQLWMLLGPNGCGKSTLLKVYWIFIVLIDLLFLVWIMLDCCLVYWCACWNGKYVCWIWFLGDKIKITIENTEIT